MFSNVLRQQARLSLRTVARAAAPASRTLSSLVLRQVVAAPVVSKLAVARPFSSASVLAYERREQREPSPPSESIYVGNMPWDMTKEDLTELFSEFGQIESVRIQTHADGRPRGFSHITFANVAAATAAVTSSAEEALHVAGRDLYVDYARSNNASKLEPTHKVYFARFNQDENALRQVFEEFKEQIVSVYFIRDGNTGEKTNAGFVEFEDIPTATQAIEKLNGAVTEDGPILLAYARARREGGSGGGGDRRNQNRGGRSSEGRSHYSQRGYQSRESRDSRY